MHREALASGGAPPSAPLPTLSKWKRPLRRCSWGDSRGSRCSSSSVTTTTPGNLKPGSRGCTVTTHLLEATVLSRLGWGADGASWLDTAFQEGWEEAPDGPSPRPACPGDSLDTPIHK